MARRHGQAQRLFNDSLRRYLELGASGQPVNRLELLLPHVQFNENGEVILLPGEIFCRIRDDNNDICPFVVDYRRRHGKGGIRYHYRYAHNLPAEKRKLTHRYNHFLEKAARWYDEVVRAKMPLWLPRDATDSPILHISFPLFLDDEANEESNQDGNS
ncbi:hypothetical protein TGAM01_v200385 [Trichoderma gamsii]|uniref:Uncharacterized protein n=1 Tax=Trichoderma gamsii TaxID=398673 RepID=A0A2P5A365_9HYPO|nr:hypothetical protein TGAM01_v200385 [Trichoderma gamsii]PON30965.1 hypothetical protein TGAM01_v200385 [Trichoderma gamsii]